jgi:prepilin-type N-terminal cleavage/methylation domain-containing protein
MIKKRASKSSLLKNTNMASEGFSLLELMIVLGIVAIIVSFSMPQMNQFFRLMRYLDYASQTEYLAKYAKLYAMERTVNVGICFSSDQISLRDLGTSRSANVCTGGTVVRTIAIPAVYSYLSFSGNNASLDPRGLAITTGSLCTLYGTNSTTVCIGKTRINKIEGTGGVCSTCP